MRNNLLCVHFALDLSLKKRKILGSYNWQGNKSIMKYGRKQNPALQIFFMAKTTSMYIMI